MERRDQGGMRRRSPCRTALTISRFRCSRGRRRRSLASCGLCRTKSRTPVPRRAAPPKAHWLTGPSLSRCSRSPAFCFASTAWTGSVLSQSGEIRRRGRSGGETPRLVTLSQSAARRAALNFLCLRDMPAGFPPAKPSIVAGCFTRQGRWSRLGRVSRPVDDRGGGCGAFPGEHRPDSLEQFACSGAAERTRPGRRASTAP